jgi:hypothetical protein
MIRGVVAGVCAGLFLAGAVACGNNEGATSAPAPAAPPPPAAPATPKVSATSVSLVEPGDGGMGGHIDTFRWSPVEGADGYVIKIIAVTGNRVVWESAPMKETEAKLPPTVALEPEVHTWSVTALKGPATIATSPTFRFTITP